MTYAFSIASNSPTAPTGYGVQTQLLVDRLKRDKHDVAILSNYGLEGAITTYKSRYGKVPHYPRGYTLYSGDVLASHHAHFLKGRDIPNALITLYDAWVYDGAPGVDELNIWSWTPVDHITVPPNVAKWAMKPNVKTIAMTPFGQKAFQTAGVDAAYIPHAVDTKVYKPVNQIAGVSRRDYFGIPDDAFLVGMVSANKANGSIHRKAFAENLLAFALFQKEHPNSYIYLHAEPTKVFGGFHLPHLLSAVGLKPDNVIFPDPEKMRYGYSTEEMAGLYSAMDVLLHASYGEGFGVPAIEAQACGTPVIGSNWAATPDVLGEDSWLVDGQPFWDEAQGSFYMIPLVNSLVNALKLANERRGLSEASVEFAKAFDVEAVWSQYWQPFIKSQLE